jgi:hypothetical protein
MSLSPTLTRRRMISPAALAAAPVTGLAQATKIDTEFLMTLYAPLDAPLAIGVRRCMP